MKSIGSIRRRFAITALATISTLAATSANAWPWGKGDHAVPEKIKLVPDDYYLTHVGKLVDGRAFWIDLQHDRDAETGQTFIFVCTYIFDADGNLVSHDIQNIGAHPVDWEPIVEMQLASLGKTVAKPFKIRPFSIEAHGTTFGVVVRVDEEYPDEEPSVDVLPGYTIMFIPPWSKGEYDS